MPATILVGVQWGDEGKGRVADWLAIQADVVGRYAGGDNAGHTVQLGEQSFKLHLIPSGILQHHVICVLGHGMVINPERLLAEIGNLAAQGIDTSPERLLVSERAHIITPGHIALDSAHETALGDQSIGTTKRGIGPAYTDKIKRTGIQAGLMRSPEAFGERIRQHIENVNASLPTAASALDADTITAEYTAHAEALAPYVTNTVPPIHTALRSGKQLLCEGAQGTLLDIDMGHYPYVTSSSASVGGALTGLGFGPSEVERVVGVAKAFSTRVGSGPMPTELHDEVGDRLRGTGDNPWDEFGTTTGRPRRCGWLDGVVLRYAAQVNGLTELVLTKLDVLSGFETINVAVAYEIDGVQTEDLPGNEAEMARAVPVYETLPGWKEDIMHVRDWHDLPPAAQNYVNFIASLVHIPITYLSVGPERNQIIVL
ncbi:MAG: adenylosuccinate synthase [Chloroflexi bacterium]|nr:adenylosuccinate synthase [Chloroflexota bacterium]